MSQEPLATGEPEGPAVQPEAAPGQARRRRRWWFWPLAVLIQVLLLVVLLLAWVLGTESGLRTALALADDLLPGVVRADQVQGRLAGDLHLTGLRVRLPGLHLSAAELHLRWRPWGALTGTLHVESLAARDLSIATAPSPPDPKPLTLPTLVLPVGIEIGQATVEGLRISELPMSRDGKASREAGAGSDEEDLPPPFVVDRVALAAGLHAGRLELHELAVDLSDFRLQARAQGQGELAGDYPLGLDLTWTLILDSRGSGGEPANLKGGGRISGDLSRLRIEYAITGAAELDLSVDVTGVLSAPAWDGRLELHRVDLPAFNPGLPTADLYGTLVSVGDRDQASVKGRLDGQVTGPAAASVPGLLGADLDLLWAGDGLTVRTLRIEEGATGGYFTAAGTLDPGHGNIDLKGDWEGLRWPLAGPALVEAPRGKVTVVGALDAYRYTLIAEATGPQLPPATLDLKGTGSRTGSHLDALRLDTLDGRIEASGDLGWDPVPRWNLKVAAKGLDPGHLVPDLPARVSFEAESAGTLDGYDLNLTGETAGPALPAAQIALAATGNLKSAKVETLHLDTLGGRIDVQGQVAWTGQNGDPEPSWDASLSAADIDPGKHWPDWPGKLAGRVASRGRVTPAGPELGAELADVQGELRGYPVAASGKVRVAGPTVTIDEFLASSGPSKARVSGSLGERLDLAFVVDSPDLKTLLPEARGSVKADGSVLGTATAPEVKLKLSAKGVQVAGQGVESLEGQADVGLGPQGRFDLRLKGRKLAAGGLTWQDLDVLGEGSMADHRLSASLKGDPLSVRLKATGGRKPDNAYQGTLAELELASKDYGQWRLQRPAPIAVAPPKVSAGPLCLRDGKGTGGSGGCVGFDQTAAGKWAADIDLDRLAFARLAPLLPRNLTLDGAASLKGRFAADGPVLTGSAALAVPKGSLKVTLGRETQVLDFSSARLDLDSGAKGLTAKLDLPLAGVGGANADLTLAGWRLDAPARPDQPLAGRVRAQVTDLKRIGKLIPEVTGVTGALDLDLGLSGNLGRPGVKGGGRLSGVAFDVPLLGLAVRNLSLTADSVAANQIVYNGGLDLGGGRLNLTGDSLLVGGAAGWLTKFRITGDRLKVANSKEYFALISPDIALQVGSGGLDVSGELRVPEARIRPRAIPPGTVSPSGDVVVGTRAADGTGGAKRAEPFPVVADVRLVLGDKVSIDAFGLRGLLRGDLRVIKAPGREPVGDGQISVVDGTYRLSGGLRLMAAVGKPLTVEQGILVFAGTPLSNPGLVLTAQREGGDVTAGVRVLGTIKKPKLAFFSESDPDMSQSEITSYLITGVPPKRDSKDDARSLAVGTYLSPKLYMEYESNLGDAADKVKLRYELNNRVELQTETGSGQGADIFYKFEN